MEDRRARPLLFVFLLAVAVRLILLYALHPVSLRGEEDLTLRLARALVAYGGGPSFSSLWAHFVAVPLAIFHNAWSARVFCAVAGAANVALLYRIAERALDARAALVAGILYAFYPEQALFSHCLYAVVPLEFFTLLAVAILFEGWPSKPTSGRAVTAFLALGVGTLLSPLGLISWAALVFAFRSARSVVIAAPAMLVPVFLFSLWSWSVSGDATAFLHRPRTGAGMSLAIPATDSAESTVARNFANLWTPNSYAAERFRVRYYRSGDSEAAGILIALAHVAVVALGLVGLVASPRSHLKIYSAASLILLSSLSVMWLLVSRYRVFEMHVFILYAAYAITHGGYVRGVITERRRLATAGALLIAFGAVCVARWSTIGSWP